MVGVNLGTQLLYSNLKTGPKQSLLFLGTFCSVLVKENDFYFGKTCQNGMNVDACFSLDR